MTIEKLSRIGIGMYRMCLGNKLNENALFKALRRETDINVIDTSTNYCDGESESLVGKVLTSSNDKLLSRSEICLATKYGYIQGNNMTLYRNGSFKNIPDEHIVRYSPNCFHCIHPEFMRDQLTRSLHRMQTSYVDILFIHNPEYFLMDKIKSSNENVKGYQNQMLDRISQSFEAMEEAIHKGQILSYGISSNSFSLAEDDKHFLPFYDLIDRAKEASKRVRKTENHGFAAVQMPANLLETYGLKTAAKWAKQNGLKVFINRPLNAFNSDGAFRLASYPKANYETIKSSTVSYLETLSQGRESNSIHSILDLVKQMNNRLPLIKNVFEWENYRIAVYSSIRQFREDIDIDTVLRPFLDAFEAEVRYRGSQAVRNYLIEKLNIEELKDENKSIEQVAMEFLFNSGVVDVVLMGMTREKYVDFAKEMIKH
ncbi:Aldo/keto reductase [Rhizophagus irregularis]|uniref:Aldo/keto reductase n=1 Tax=Rhizophagus irregularis TaxID=588596 RepID=A0A2N0QCC2_9GLOM|nr:Aldo/keto reductase [Rhizophagus irregularis]